MHVIINPVGY